jgi:hypothetical protein
MPCCETPVVLKTSSLVDDVLEPREIGRVYVTHVRGLRAALIDAEPGSIQQRSSLLMLSVVTHRS